MKNNSIAVVCAGYTEWQLFIRKMTVRFFEKGGRGDINTFNSRIRIQGYTEAVLFPVYEYYQVRIWEPTHFILESIPDECKDWEIISARLRKHRAVLISCKELCKLYTENKG